MSVGAEKVTSLQNARVKAIRALDMRKARRETGLFVAEGASVMIAAREAGIVPDTVVHLADHPPVGVVGDLIAWAGQQGADVIAASQAVLAKISGKDNPQVVLGVYRQRWAALPPSGTVAGDAVWLALEEVRDPGNLGTIIRTMDAVGGAGVMLIGRCCDPYSRECVRATMGSVFSVGLVRVSIGEFRSWREEFAGDVVGTHLSGTHDFRKVEYRGPVVLMMGSEGPGLSEQATALCSMLVRIPMAGKLDSLNLAVATALALYQIQSDRLRL